jgi:5-(carboxyamino)imidazole ribonucleotide synthase
MSPIAPGATIGILGGGQLGRMTAMAAASLGYRCNIFAPEADSPAADVSAAFTCAAWDDQDALDRFATAVDVVTLEFENVPVSAVERLARHRPVRPGASVLSVTQDRVAEKSFVNEVGIPTAPWRAVVAPDDLAAAREALGGSVILKTCRLGYDGKGQIRVEAGDDPGRAWAALHTSSAIAEAVVDFSMELSVVTARGADGEQASYVAVENRHEHHILRTTIAPAPLSPELATEAKGIAERLARSLDAVGLVAVEMFLTRDGRLLVNELAPRPHNSGHWTIEGCPVSQFEQLVRAVCGLPLGDPTPVAAAEMTNLLGDEAEGWPAILAEPGARLHLYGKREARAGRKMGHVTRLRPFTR